MVEKPKSAELKSTSGKRYQFFQRFDIMDPDGEGLYLRRWYIVSTPWFGIYLHHIYRHDLDRALHDHPWNFLSLILWGGYTEERAASDGDRYVVKRKRWSLARRKATDLHAITEIDRSPTWTLCLVGRRQRVWGFLVPDDVGTQWVDWETYLAQR